MLSYRTWSGVTRGFKLLFSTGSNTLGPASKQRFGGAIRADPLLHSQGSSVPSALLGPPRLSLPTIPRVGQPTLGEVTVTSRVECTRPIHTDPLSPLLTLGASTLSKILQAAATASFQPNRRPDRRPATPSTLTLRFLPGPGGAHIRSTPLLPFPRQIGGHHPPSLGPRQSRWRSQRLSRLPSAISKPSIRSSTYASKQMRCRTEGIPWSTEPDYTETAAAQSHRRGLVHARCLIDLFLLLPSRAEESFLVCT